MKDTSIQKLKDRLLNASTQKGQELLDSVVNAIQETTNCRMCSLWVINENRTNDESQKTASLIARTLETGINYSTNNREDYAHVLDKCFIEHVLSKTKETKEPFYCCSLEECNNHNYRSKKMLEQLNLKYFIHIPIPNLKNTRIIALLELSFIEKHFLTHTRQKKYLESFSISIRNMISSCFFRYMVYSKQEVIDELAKKYNERGSKKYLGDILHPIINTTFRKYFTYEDASVFIWDHYMNHYVLLCTTGTILLSTITGMVEVTNKSDYKKISYQIDENYTGKAAKYQKSIIINDLDGYRGKSVEKTKSKGQTMMIVPILRPSKRDEVIGLLRFVNKKNKINGNVIDYFYYANKKIIEYASEYLALIIDYFLAEEERNDFISKLSHEFMAPALSIHNHAHSLIRWKRSNMFLFNRRLDTYMNDIKILSDLQLRQAETNLYISKVRVHLPRSRRYEKMGYYLLRDVIKQGKNTVIPFAEMEDVRYDKIEIDYFPNWKLYIDEGAFTIVFFNLLTNAIKYRIPIENEKFSVNITCKKDKDWLIICVSDYGLGINKADKERIFLMGVRGDNVTRYETGGFGIGLPVVMQIVTDFGGKICVFNLQNPTTFEIKLPKKLFDDKYTKETEWNSVK